MKILLTGFTPFGGLTRNPSQQIVEHLARVKPVSDLVTAVLPTEYERAGERIRALIRDVEPDAVICLGVAQKRAAINLERIALNLNDSPASDNAGVVAEKRCIESGGLPTYQSTLPLTKMANALRQHDIPVQLSDDAGKYVCNHVFYVARHALEQAGRVIPCGFIHVPAVTDDEPGLPLATLIQAVKICLDTLAETD